MRIRVLQIFVSAESVASFFHGKSEEGAQVRATGGGGGEIKVQQCYTQGCERQGSVLLARLVLGWYVSHFGASALANNQRMVGLGRDCLCLQLQTLNGRWLIHECRSACGMKHASR